MTILGVTDTPSSTPSRLRVASIFSFSVARRTCRKFATWMTWNRLAVTPTTYRVCGSAIEKVGPASDQVRPIVFCADRIRLSSYGNRLSLLMAYCIGEMGNEARLPWTRIALLTQGWPDMNHRVLHYVPFHRAEDWSKGGWIVVRPNIQCHIDAYVVVMEWLCGCAMPRPNKNASVDILCRSPGASSQELESMAIEASSQDADAMRKPKPSPDDGYRACARRRAAAECSAAR